MNGILDRGGAPDKKNHRNYKLLTDPFLIKGAAKIYRYDGVVPNDPTHPIITPRDPRNPISRIRSRLDTFEMIVPR